MRFCTGVVKLTQCAMLSSQALRVFGGSIVGAHFGKDLVWSKNISPTSFLLSGDSTALMSLGLFIQVFFVLLLVSNCGFEYDENTLVLIHLLIIVQTVSPNPTTAHRFYYCICASACQPASLWKELSFVALAACFSDILFERLLGCFSLQTECQNCFRNG